MFAAYKKGDWTISGFFAITGGGGKASFDDGLPMFESLAMAGIFQESVMKHAQTGGKSPILTPDMYTVNSAMEGKQYIYSVQLGLTYKITEWLSAFAGGRMNSYMAWAITGPTSGMAVSSSSDMARSRSIDCA